MITLTYTLFALLPALVTVLACLALVPCLVWWHHARATRPVDAPSEEGWALDLLAELNAKPVRVRWIGRTCVHPALVGGLAYRHEATGAGWDRDIRTWIRERLMITQGARAPCAQIPQ